MSHRGFFSFWGCFGKFAQFKIGDLCQQNRLLLATWVLVNACSPPAPAAPCLRVSVLPLSLSPPNSRGWCASPDCLETSPREDGPQSFWCKCYKGHARVQSACFSCKGHLNIQGQGKIALEAQKVNRLVKHSKTTKDFFPKFRQSPCPLKNRRYKTMARQQE